MAIDFPKSLSIIEKKYLTMVLYERKKSKGKWLKSDIRNRMLGILTIKAKYKVPKEESYKVKIR